MRREQYHQYKMREGFSLVEVIIAVTVLAILTLPILAYVTNASVSTSKGRDTQQANLAGETMMEDIKAVESFDKLEAYAAVPGGDWTVSLDAPNNKAVVTKDVTLDGFTYHVTADVDYNYASNDSTGRTETYNAYKIPELKEVYSPNNAVLEETDQAETALSEFYYENQSEQKAAILDAMKRALCIDVEQTTDNGRSIYWVKGYYKYWYGGEKKTFSIRNIKIEKSKLENIYVFYKVLNKNILSEKAEVRFLNFTDNDDIKKLKIYFALQDTPATSVDATLKKPAAYVMDINSTSTGVDNPEPLNPATIGAYNNASYFTNGIDKAGTSPVANFEKSLVKRETGKRIAQITVDVYKKKSSGSYLDSERLVRLQSSKGN